MGLSKLSEKCRNCLEVDNCQNKRMEAYAMASLPMTQPMLRGTIVINTGESHLGRETVYKDELAKEINKELYKTFRIGAMRR